MSEDTTDILSTLGIPQIQESVTGIEEQVRQLIQQVNQNSQDIISLNSDSDSLGAFNDGGVSEAGVLGVGGNEYTGGI